MDVFLYWYILATPVPTEVTPMSIIALAWAALLLLCNHITPQNTSTSNATTSPQSKPLISHDEGSRCSKSAIIFLDGLAPALSGFCKTLLGYKKNNLVVFSTQLQFPLKLQGGLFQLYIKLRKYAQTFSILNLAH